MVFAALAILASCTAAAGQTPAPDETAPQAGAPQDIAPQADPDADTPDRPSLPRQEWVGPRPEQDFACRYSGGEADQGAVRCIARSSCEIVTARCERRANNAVWITLEQGCDIPVS